MQKLWGVPHVLGKLYLHILKKEILIKPVDTEICRVLLTFIIGFLRTSREIGLFTKRP